MLFEKNLIELASNIAKNIVDILEETDGDIKTNMENLRNYIEKGKERSSTIFKQYCKEENALCLHSQFKILCESLHITASSIASYKNKIQPVVRSGERLSAIVEDLEKRFKAFTKIISRFKTINIASRIEVAKQQSLVGMDDTVEEMATFTDRIAQDVHRAHSSSQAFIADSKNAILSYNHIVEEEFINMGRAEAGLLDIKETLSKTSTVLLDKIEEFTLFNDSFIERFTEANQIFEQSKKTNIIAHKIKKTFADFLKEKANRLEEAGIQDNSVNIENEHLRALIQQYTSYAHRRSQEQSDKAELDGFIELSEEDFF